MENNRYKIERKIKEDEFSTTYKAYDNKLNRFLSLKEFNDKSCFERSIEKLKSLSNLHHPNILELYDLIIEKEEKCSITYEYFNGITLDSFFSRKSISDNDLIEILKKIVLGLIYCENNDVYCGKLELSNLLINENLIVKLDIFNKYDYDNFENDKSQFSINKNVILNILDNSNLYIDESKLSEINTKLSTDYYSSLSSIYKDLNTIDTLIDNNTDEISAVENFDNTIKLDLKNEKESKMSYKIDEDILNENTTNNKRESGFLKAFLVYFTSVLLAFFVACACVFYYNLRPKAPDYVGKNLSIAVNQATQNKIELVVDKSLNVDKSNLNKYVVVSQSPKVGSKLLFNRKIKLQLGMEKDKTMVNLVGSSLKKAERKLSELGLNLKKIKYKKSSVYDKGTVIYQSVESGKKINDGDFISITVSSGRIVKTQESEQNTEQYTPPEENERPKDDEINRGEDNNYHKNEDKNQNEQDQINNSGE
ncbi:PASTA domain-containing protein [uncultured Finegoldia sp.]|uniref:PASTA domain-containing protein n=1 Tax=uncultured Finegoldia sp. TaxID=328009 RepID=UPI002611EDC5|nr:PASTA domain-containing protein [uncultured Finegoldia sp.]